MDHVQQTNVAEWNRRAGREGLYAVFTTRWTQKDCAEIDAMQKEIVFSLLPSLTDCTILDLGCGIGRLTTTLSQRAERVVGIDISAEMLRRARAEVGTRPCVTLLRASAGFMPLSDRQFDVVVASYVLQHILDDRLFEYALNEIARLLKPGGLALLVDSLDAHPYYPTNSDVTVIRTWDQYVRRMEPRFHLLARRLFRCVEDDYTLMLWERQRGE